MSRFPIECKNCGATYNSRDEMKKKSKGGGQALYHCTECSIEVLGLTIKNGAVLDSTVF